MIILETERLILREYTSQDHDDLKKIIGDAENMKYFPKPYDDKGVDRWINWCIDSYNNFGFGLWAMILKGENKLIGDCGVSIQFFDKTAVPEIGYHLNPDYQHKGYATEAAMAVKKWLFENTPSRTAYSIINKLNLPSRRVAERNGMTLVGEFEEYGMQMVAYSCKK